MLILATSALLAQVPTSEIYVSTWKLIVTLVLFSGWTLFATWVNKDTRAVNTFQQIWNMITLGLGAVSLGLLLFLPIYWAGLAAFVVINGAVAIAYVIHRNGLVLEEDKVMTVAHIQRLMKEGFRGKKGEKSKIDVKERVRLMYPSKKAVTIPEEDIEREKFQLTQDLLFDAFWHRASALEIIPAGQTSKVRTLVDGIASERERPRTEGEAVLMYLKSIAGLNLEDRRRPQMGKMFAQMGEHRHELQIRTDGSTAGEKLSLRLIGQERGFKIADLGFTDAQLKQFKEIMEAPNGVVVISAPAGNGLTTTMYSVARSHDAFLQNIQLVELERELDIDNITQHTYVQSDERPFALDVQKVIRTDPDVVILPEIRDKQTAAIVCQAANHKQNMYVGVKANDLVDAMNRWVLTVGEPALAAKTLLAVTHQRLIRKLCTSCKTPYKPDAAMLAKLNLPADKVLFRPPDATYDKHGNPVLCQACQGTGYVGRTAVFGILPLDDELRAVIRDGGDATAMKTAAMKKGGVSLQPHALQKVLDGTTSIDEVVRATRPPGSAPTPASKPVPQAGAATTPAKAAPKSPSGPAKGGATARS